MHMTTAEAIRKIQSEFDINAIYAHGVYSLTRSEDFMDEAAKIIEGKPKPFVKWVGGKRQLLRQFREMRLYPPEKFNPKSGRYFEPFVGGGAVFFDLLPRRAFLSDLNSELVVTYNVIKKDVEKLIISLKEHKINKEYYLRIRAQNPRKLSDVDAASRFIYLNRTCFNGVYRVNSSGGFNVPFGKYTSHLICDEVNLRKVSKALKEVEIKKQDYKEVLKKAKKGDFVYFDPPYHPMSSTASFTSYTKEDFSKEDQIELKDIFVKLHRRGCFVMLSNSDTPFMNEIYSGIKGIRIAKVQAGRMINSQASGRGKISELLVTNY